MEGKKYRFFYHYNKHNKALTLHFRNICYVSKNILCNVSCESKWNKKQPMLTMQGFCSKITQKDDLIIVD